MRFQVTKETVKTTGRILYKDGTAYLGFSGSSISFTFVGKKAEICIWSDADIWAEELKGQVAVYVNDEAEPVKRICLGNGEVVYTLYESDVEEKVTITLMKYSEAAFSMCGVRYIEVDGEQLCTPPEAKERKMEIIGDSITCGYGVEADSEAQPFHTATENPTKSYSLLTAKALGADVNLVSWSGNGITSKYVEETATEPLTEGGLMPKVYQYTDISGSERLYGADESKWEKWDFSRFVPDIILVNLGTNDCSWCKDIQERKDTYRDEYVKFLKYIRTNNPNAEILCMLGTMDQRVLKELEEAVQIFAEEQQDSKVHFLALQPQNPEDGYGADWHPCALTHRMTAEVVVEEVRKIMNWQD